jgi:hypothetical protein
MRAGRYLTEEEWEMAVHEGLRYVKRYTKFAKQHVQAGNAYVAKVRPKLHELQHMCDFLLESQSRHNPARDACWMDEDGSFRSMFMHGPYCLLLLPLAQDYVKKFLCVQKVLHYKTSSLTILQRSLISAKADLENLGFGKA